MKCCFGCLVGLITAISGLAAERQVGVLSIPPRASLTASGNSFAPQFSANGRFLLFASHAKNLTTNVFSSMALNIFRYDLLTGEIVLVSTASDGARAGDKDSAFYSISTNGEFVAFASLAANLVSNDTNSVFDVFVRGLADGSTHLVSANAANNTPSDPNPGSSEPLSSNPTVSADARWVAFESRSTDVDARASRSNLNVFVTDLSSNKTVLASVTADGGSPLLPARSHSARLSADGRFVTFVSSATNLVSETTPQEQNLYQRDLQQESTAWLSKDLSGYLGSWSNGYQIVEYAASADGHALAYKVTHPQTGLVWVFRYDVTSGSTLLLATNSYYASTPAMSADGRFVAYESGTNIFVWDDLNESNILASVDLTGSQPAAGISHTPALSEDGGYLAFVSDAGNLVSNSAGGQFQVYWRDLVAGSTRLVSRNTNGASSSANHEFSVPAIRSDGLHVAFESTAPDLVADDLNKATDVFVYNVEDDSIVAVSKAHPSRLPRTAVGSSSVGRNAVTADGGLAVFCSDSYTTNPVTSVVLHDLGSGTIRVLRSETNLLVDAEVSADGHYVAYTRRNSAYSSLDFRDDLVRHDLRIGTSQVATGAVSSIFLPHAVSHITSSNGQFAVLDDAHNVSVHDFSSNADILISNGSLNGGSSPALSADDQKLFFLGFRSGAPMAVYLKLLNDSAPPRLVSHAPESAAAIDGTALSITIAGNSQSAVFGMYTNPTADRVLFRYDIASDAVSQVCTLCQNGSLDNSGALLAYEFVNSNAMRSVYLRDLETGQSVLLSSPGDLGVPSESLLDSWSPVISGDRRFILFFSRLATSRTNSSRLYLRDRALNQTLLLTPNAEGIGLVTGNGAQLSLSRDGRTAIFRSFAGDLVAGDYNDKRDVFVVRLGANDSDGDGMDDDWEVAYFGDLSRDGSGDFDGDGQTDLQEFRAGTDPTNNNSVLRAITVTQVGGGTTVFWNAVAGRSYRVEFKEKLDDATWTAVSGQVQVTGLTGWIGDSSASSASHRFYRVVALR